MEAKLNYFSQEMLDSSLDASNANSKSFAQALKTNYQSLKTQLKSEIKNNIAELNKKHLEALNEIKATEENSLKELNEKYAQIAEKTKKDTKDYSDAKKGIEIVAKRARSKENNVHNSDIKQEKNHLVDLFNEYAALKNNASLKLTPLDRLEQSNTEFVASFNPKEKLTNKKTWINLVPLFMLILIIIAYYIGKSITGYSGNLGDVINNGIFVAIVATGAVFIYSQGGFDMSLGSAALTCATVAALTYNATGNVALTLILAVVLGASLGIINAILATMLGLPVMVMTLTMMNVLSAINESIIVSPIFPNAGLPTNAWVYASILLIFFLICWFIFNYTKVGRRNKFIGSNKVAAKFNGINLMTSGIISFAISGIGLGLCGFIFASSKSGGGQFQTSTVLSQVGLNVVIAIVFGGMTTSGGPKSKISCAIIGAFFSVFLDEFFAAISTPTFAVGDYCYMVKGIIFLVVSLANMWDTRSKMLASGGSIQ